MFSIDELRQGAEQGDAAAQYLLGKRYLRGAHGATTDASESIKWFRASAAQSYADALARLESIVRKGSKDALEAISQLAHQDNAAAQSSLGRCFKNGWGIATDVHEAVSWFRKAADQGNNASAQQQLGSCYLRGRGVDKDINQAFKWFQMAAEQGDAKGQHALGALHDSANDASEALKWYHKSAEQGHAAAHVSIGVCYENGRGVDKDASEAVKWYRRAAEHGDADGQYHLGDCLQRGSGITKSLNEAASWFRKAAEQRHVSALYSFAICLRDGLGVVKDDKSAFRLFLQAADEGHAAAQGQVGRCYWRGVGVTRNMNEAAKWFPKAAKHGDPFGAAMLAVYFLEGYGGVNKDISKAFRYFRASAEQGEKTAFNFLLRQWSIDNNGDARARAIAMISELAHMGNGAAQFCLGYCHQNGWGVNKDPAETVKWYRKAADQGHIDAFEKLGNQCEIGNKDAFDSIFELATEGCALAQCCLGLCYHKGWTIERDHAESVRWFRKAAEQGLVEGQYSLAFCYQEGEGVMQDLNEAFNWHRKAADQGLAHSQHYVGECYRYGNGVPKNLDAAFNLYHMAADRGYADGQNSLGLCYLKGVGVARDRTKAARWFRLAAEQGLAAAQKNLADCFKNGWGVRKNLAEAVAWYRKAGEKGETSAYFLLGTSYECGLGVSKDHNEAVKWYRMAADKGHQSASASLKYCLRYGDKDAFNIIRSESLTAADLSCKKESPLVLVESFESHVANANGMLTSPDARLLAVFRKGDFVVMFEAFTWKEKWRKRKPIQPKLFSPDGKYLLVCYKNSPTVFIMDANTGALVRELCGRKNPIKAVAWCLSSNYIAACSDDNNIRIFRPDGKRVRTVTKHHPSVKCVAFLGDGGKLASCTAPDGVHLWDVATGTFRHLPSRAGNCVSISPDGRFTAGASLDQLRIYQVADGKHVSTLNLKGELGHLNGVPTRKMFLLRIIISFTSSISVMKVP